MTTCECKKPILVHVTDKGSAFFVDQKIGKRMSLTPEGFLLCEAVPIARVGEQIYGPGETPLETGDDDLLRVQRDEEEVFRPETIASFEGKDVVDEHPEEGVSPENWRNLSVGHAQNVRRGSGVENDYLLADLLIKDPDAIKAVMDGKREISCGYDCEYEQTGDGTGRQYNIVGNHIALVERGRCGPRCSIKDSIHKENAMAKKPTVKDRLMGLLGVKDAEEFEKALAAPAAPAAAGEDDEAGESAGSGVEVHNHIHLPGEAPASAGGEAGIDDAEEPAGGAAGEGGEALPSYFLEHVAQSNARFDRMEQMLTKLLGMEQSEQEGAGAAAEEGEESDDLPDDPDLQAEIGEGDEAMEEEPERAGDETAEEEESAADEDILGMESPDGAEDEDILGMESPDGAEDRARDGDRNFTDMAEWMRAAKLAGAVTWKNESGLKAGYDSSGELVASWDFPMKTGTVATTKGGKGKAKDAKSKGKGKKGGKGKGKVTDSSPLADSFRETCSTAEILLPGVKLPTFDRRANLKATFDQICKIRRRVLDKAYQNEELHAVIDSLNGRKLNTKNMSCGAIRVLFRSVGAMQKRTNDSAVVFTAGGGTGVSNDRKIKSPAELNKYMADHYKTVEY